MVPQRSFPVGSLGEGVVDMNELRNGDLFVALSTTWDAAINEGRPRDVILGALLANMYFRETRDEPFEHGVLIYVRKAIDDILEAVGKSVSDRPTHACSFCGRTEPDVRLAAGATSFICDSCVSTLADVFGRSSKAGAT
jgi:hypothetical protein